MAVNEVKFIKTTSLDTYNGVLEKDANTLYFVVDPSQGNHLFLGADEITDPSDLEAAVSRISALETDSTNLKSVLSSFLTEPTSDAVKTYIDGIKNELSGKIGETGSLTTDAKDNLVAAINEVDAAVDALKTTEAVTVEAADDDVLLKKYTIKQGGVPVGVTIDIPKDMVVNGGSVVLASSVDGGIQVGEGEPVTDDTKFLRLDIANQEEPVYIPVSDLVDAYTAQQGAAEVQIAISGTNEISATLVTGSITKDKLAADIQTSLGKADTSIQKVETGSVAGAVSVTDAAGSQTSVPVFGLKPVATSGEATDVNYNGEKTVKQILDELSSSLGAGGSVDEQIKKSIQELDSNTAATDGSVLTGVTITDGKITDKTEVALTAENIKYGEASTVDAELDKLTGGAEVSGSVANQVAAAKTELIGKDADEATADTIKAAKKYAKEYTDSAIEENALTWETI